MRKRAKDPIREDRIHNEAIVDAYGSEEKAMSWYYYLEDKIRFPFQAKCIVANLVSPLKKGDLRSRVRIEQSHGISNKITTHVDRRKGKAREFRPERLAGVDPESLRRAQRQSDVSSRSLRLGRGRAEPLQGNDRPVALAGQFSEPGYVSPQSQESHCQLQEGDCGRRRTGRVDGFLLRAGGRFFERSRLSRRELLRCPGTNVQPESQSRSLHC